MHPQGFPYRNHPKAVIKQVKRVCEAYPNGMKLRTVTDAEARRSFDCTRSDRVCNGARTKTLAAPRRADVTHHLPAF